MCALCGFVFGVACKLPPSLTILILNGCFCFPICRYLIYQATTCRHIYHGGHGHNRSSHNKNGYIPISNDNNMETEQPDDNDTEQNTEIEQKSPKGCLKHLLISLTILGFLMQLGALVSIPILLSENSIFSPSGRLKHNVVATYILIPVSLLIISIVWSGWIQNVIIRTSHSNNTARLKAGSYITDIA